MRLSQKARLYGMDCLVCLERAEVLRRYWCLSLGLMYRSVEMLFSALSDTVTSRK